MDVGVHTVCIIVRDEDISFIHSFIKKIQTKTSSTNSTAK